MEDLPKNTLVCLTKDVGNEKRGTNFRIVSKTPSGEYLGKIPGTHDSETIRIGNGSSFMILEEAPERVTPAPGLFKATEEPPAAGSLGFMSISLSQQGVERAVREYVTKTFAQFEGLEFGVELETMPSGVIGALVSFK